MESRGFSRHRVSSSAKSALYTVDWVWVGSSAKVKLPSACTCAVPSVVKLLAAPAWALMVTTSGGVTVPGAGASVPVSCTC